MIALKRAGTEDKRPINNMILVVQLLLLLLIITDKINKTFPTLSIFKRGTVRWRFLSNIVIWILILRKTQKNLYLPV